MGSTGYQENMYPCDSERAEELLGETGWSEIELIYIAYYQDIASALKQQLEKVGITVSTYSLSFQMLEDRIKNKNYNMFIFGYNWPLADMIWWEWHTCRIPTPNRFWWGDNYTDAIIKNTFSFDDEVALRALQESQRLIAEDAASIGLLHPNFIIAHRSRVKGFDISAGLTSGPTGIFMRVPWHFLDTYIEGTE